MQAQWRGINTDHLPIITALDLTLAEAPPSTARNFRDVDWDHFRETLGTRLATLGVPNWIKTQAQMDNACEKVTLAIQDTIAAEVPMTNISPKTKRWWTRELTNLRRQANRLGRQAHKLKSFPDNPIHEEHNAARRLYDKTLKDTKRQHWRDWLEKAEDPDIWTAHKYFSSPAGDGGKTRIPVLKYTSDGKEKKATTNSEKGVALAKSFFPPKPTTDNIPQDYTYPEPVCDMDPISRDQIEKHLHKLKPYKAPGPDSIPNIVLSKCADLLIDRLFYIYTAMSEQRLFFAPWKSFTTVVLRKPGKPRYDTPKSYRPIALLNTMWKVLTAILAELLMHYAETHKLLPENHFGGRKGRTTSDAMHLLAYKIKGAWRKREVAAVLFLDIEGAFPNAVPLRLVHNMKRRGIPAKLANFIYEMLQNRATALRFDDYTTDPIEISNGIGQGDPLSMALYQFYNADILDVPKGPDESAVAYVDDALLIATAKTFTEAHHKLTKMMTRRGGIIEWSTAHNSPLEYTKLALIDFAHQNCAQERPPISLPNITISPSRSAKYLGVYFDQHLSWAAQHAHVIEKGSKWAAQIRRATRASWGLSPKYARRLYISVAIPKVLYGADIWYPPVSGPKAGPKRQGSVKMIKGLTTIQRAAAIAITGGLRTSPTDALDAHANLLPTDLMIDKWCHRAALRLASLPPEHPLHTPVKKCASRHLKRHRAPLHILMQAHNLVPSKIEKMPATARNPAKAKFVPLRTDIPKDKNATKIADQCAPEKVRIYTDGSAHNGKVGAAAILYRPGRPKRTLHYHLGSAEEHTVYEAELVGLLLGLQLVKTEQAGRTSFAIGADNLAAVKAVLTELTHPGQYLAASFLSTAAKIKKKRGTRNYSLTLRWTAGHIGIQGNEEADAEAKKAAEGRTSDTALLPHILRRPLATSTSAIKQKHSMDTKNKWAKRWRDSERGKCIHSIDSSTPSPKFLQAISNPKLSRRSASMITQLRINHIPLNSYLT